MKIHSVFFCLCATAVSAQAGAAGWQSSNVQLLGGSGYELGSSSRQIVTLEHARGGAWGDLFAFVDHTRRSDIGHEWYGEVYLQPSLSNLSGRSLAFGPVRDVSLSLGINAGTQPRSDPFRAGLLGLAFDFEAPGFNYLSFEVHAYKDDSVSRHGWQFTPVWERPFQVGGMRMKFRGFADVWTPRSNAAGNWSVLIDPQLVVDVGPALGLAKDRLWAGVEYRYWKRKFGIDGIDEHLPNLMLMATF